MATYVLIHGAYQGGWIWKPTAARLRDAGHLVYAPSLDGCAERRHQLRPGITIETHAADIADLLFYENLNEVVLTGNGPSFCSGGDLAEFGRFSEPASAHLARTRYSPALILDALTARLGQACRAEVHGQVLGSGLEMAAFCGRIVAAPDAVFGLPELSLGLLPGAGGTVSVTRRIGRWRTAYLVLSGRIVDTDTALAWRLVDAKSER